ncbi:MAG: hypothetical protein V3S74_03150 [Alphaproteobacteria bacterium]
MLVQGNVPFRFTDVRLVAQTGSIRHQGCFPGTQRHFPGAAIDHGNGAVNAKDVALDPWIFGFGFGCRF